jgi:hypothetical protein
MKQVFFDMGTGHHFENESRIVRYAERELRPLFGGRYVAMSVLSKIDMSHLLEYLQDYVRVHMAWEKSDGAGMATSGWTGAMRDDVNLVGRIGEGEEVFLVHGDFE